MRDAALRYVFVVPLTWAYVACGGSGPARGDADAHVIADGSQSDAPAAAGDADANDAGFNDADANRLDADPLDPGGGFDVEIEVEEGGGRFELDEGLALFVPESSVDRGFVLRVRSLTRDERVAFEAEGAFAPRVLVGFQADVIEGVLEGPFFVEADGLDTRPPSLPLHYVLGRHGRPVLQPTNVELDHSAQTLSWQIDELSPPRAVVEQKPPHEGFVSEECEDPDTACRCLTIHVVAEDRENSTSTMDGEECALLSSYASVTFADCTGSPSEVSLVGSASEGCKEDEQCPCLTHDEQCLAPFECSEEQRDCGAFIAFAKTDDEVCDDGDPCTKGDLCDGAGHCAPGAPETCGNEELGPCDTRSTCNPETGECEPEETPGPDVSCDDDNPCTKDDACSDGVCAGEPSVGEPCDDGNVCTEGDACSAEGSCVPSGPVPIGTPCDDGNLCTRLDECQGGFCLGKQPVDCAARRDCQADGICNPDTGECERGDPWPNETACDDGQACTIGDRCLDGLCLPTGPAKDGVSCSARRDCASAAQCEAGRCVATAFSEGSPCDDGRECTTDDRCRNHVCMGRLEDPRAEECFGLCAAPGSDGSPCDDGNPCTVRDVCAEGECAGRPTTGPACEPSHPCVLAAQCDQGRCVPTQTDITCTPKWVWRGAFTSTVATARDSYWAGGTVEFLFDGDPATGAISNLLPLSIRVYGSSYYCCCFDLDTGPEPSCSDAPVAGVGPFVCGIGAAHNQDGGTVFELLRLGEGTTCPLPASQLWIGQTTTDVFVNGSWVNQVQVLQRW